MTKLYVPCLVVMVLCLAVSAYADIAVEDSSIVVASELPEALEAGQALQTYLEKMTGAKPVLAQLTADKLKIPAGSAIIVAEPKQFAALKLPLQVGTLAGQVKDDGFLLWCDGKQTCVVSGQRPTSLVFAAYELLQKLGCRWYFPGELGEELPALKNVALPVMEEVQNPSMVDRNMWYAYGGRPAYQRDGYVLWRKQNRMGGVAFSAGHNLARIVPPALFAQHPEYFPVHGGQRINPNEENNWQPCTSNPEVIALAVAAADKYFTEHPEASSFSLSPNDGYGWCECDNCRAQDPPEQVQQRNQYKARRTLLFANAVAREIAKKHPGKYLAWYAYAGTVEPPTDVKAEPNVLTALAHYGYCGCNVHAMTDANCPLNQKFMPIMDGWAKQADKLMIREYWSMLCPEEDAMARGVTAYSLAEDLPLLVKRGVIAASAESEPEYGSSALNFYLAAKLMWNAEQPLEPILVDYYQGMYGPAAAMVRAFFEGIVTKVRGRGDRGAFFTDQDYVDMAAQLDGINKTAGLSDKQLGRIKMTQDFLTYTTMLRQYNLKPTKALRGEINAFVAQVEANQQFTLDTVMHRSVFNAKAAAAQIKDPQKLAVGKLKLVSPDEAVDPKALAASPCLRGTHVFALQVAPGEKLAATVTVRRLGRYTNPTAWALLDETGKKVAEGEASIEEASQISLPEAGPGTYTLIANSGSNACLVSSPLHGLCLAGGRADLLGGQPRLYFLAPQGLKAFNITLETAAPGETGKLTVLDPSGNKVGEGDTSETGQARVEVTVPAGLDGKAWSLQLGKGQAGVMEDLRLLLGEGLPPYLATAAGRVLGQ